MGILSRNDREIYVTAFRGTKLFQRPSFLPLPKANVAAFETVYAY
jgi:hypothetical protein